MFVTEMPPNFYSWFVKISDWISVTKNLAFEDKASNGNLETQKFSRIL